MTRAEQNRIHLALVHVRGAIRGWAFSDDHMLRGKLTQAEGIVASLPAALADHAEELLAPLRAKLSGADLA